MLLKLRTAEKVKSLREGVTEETFVIVRDDPFARNANFFLFFFTRQKEIYLRQLGWIERDIARWRSFALYHRVPLLEKKKTLIRLIGPSPHGCETYVFNRVHLRVIAGRKKRNIGLPGYNGTTGIKCGNTGFYNFTDSIRVKVFATYLSFNSSLYYIIYTVLMYRVMYEVQTVDLNGKRNPGFEVSLRRSSFLVAQKEDSRSLELSFSREERRNTKGTALPRARIALSRTSWIETWYYREGKFSFSIEANFFSLKKKSTNFV